MQPEVIGFFAVIILAVIKIIQLAVVWYGKEE